MTTDPIRKRLHLVAALGAALGVAAFATAQPANDDCSDAIAVSLGDSIQGTTVGAVNSGDITSCTSNDTIDVWYRFDADANVGVRVTTCASSAYDTALSVFASCGGAQIACNDDDCGLRSTVEFGASAGESYFIRVSGYNGDSGPFILDVIEVAAPPEPTVGPDVQYTDCVDVANFGAVLGVRGYALGSYTCNVGDAGLLWGFGADETPVLAMNAYRYSPSEGFRQIGQSWCKTACCAAQGSGCGLACNTVSGMLGPGCRDIYSSGYNGGQSRLAPRSSINPWTGDVTPAPGGGGDAIYKRLQVAEADMTDANATYWVEGVYVGSDDATWGNHFNNASYKRVNVTPGSYDLTVTGAMQIGLPAVYGWQDVDPDVQIVEVDVPGEGRYYVASKATALRVGYRYEYAVFNLNSQLGAGSLSVPVGASTSVSNVGFHDVDYHSGEVYDNTDWTGAKVGSDVLWASTTTYAQNQNGNAVRWGNTYSFWFETDLPPGNVQASLGLYTPNVPGSVTATVVGPVQACPADWNDDGNLNDQDFFDWVNDFFSQSGPQGQFDFNEDGFQNDQDWFDFSNAFFDPAPGCNPG